MALGKPSIAERIASERVYHATHYAAPVDIEVPLDLAYASKRRPWNLTWAYFDTIRKELGTVRGKRILVCGCGRGLTAINLAALGAEVTAFDLSEEAIFICRRRASNHHVAATFLVSAFEELPDLGSFDAVVGEMILHHVDVPAAMARVRAALKPEGVAIFAEWKRYKGLDALRERPLFLKLFPPGGIQGYATEFERKLTEEDFAAIRDVFPRLHLEHRYMLRGKLDYFLPSNGQFEKIDYLLLRTFHWLQPFTDGVILTMYPTA
jgi:SAM-dependent methyltransferase